MEENWSGPILTAFLLAPPSVLGVRALIRGPTRFRGRVVPEGMDRLAAAIWLAPFPVAIVSVLIRVTYFPPRTPAEANYIADHWGPLVLRLVAMTCLFLGGAIALATARPEEKPKVKGKSKARYKKRKR